MKLPRLPRKCSVLDAKYSAEQMREYAQKSIREYLNESYKQTMTIIPIDSQEQKSILQKLKEKW
jgi:hypothetical protein